VTRPRLRLDTPVGRILIELRPDRAPLTTAAVLACLEQGGFVGARFVRSVRPDNDAASPPIAVLQAAPDPANSYCDQIVHESTRVTGLTHVDGAVSLARGAPGSARAAGFFICIGDQPALDHGGGRVADGQGFAVFGQVISGHTVARRIWAGPTGPWTSRPGLDRQGLAPPVPFRTERLAPGAFAETRS